MKMPQYSWNTAKVDVEHQSIIHYRKFKYLVNHLKKRNILKHRNENDNIIYLDSLKFEIGKFSVLFCLFVLFKLYCFSCVCHVTFKLSKLKIMKFKIIKPYITSHQKCKNQCNDYKGHFRDLLSEVTPMITLLRRPSN